MALKIEYRGKGPIAKDVIRGPRRFYYFLSGDRFV